MKRALIALFMGLALILGSAQAMLAAAPQAVIVSPQKNEAITFRAQFPVQVSIPAYDQVVKSGQHYWVSLANVDDKSHMVSHWPKFYVKSGNFTGTLFEGGFNPLPVRQPMVILLLKVDDPTNQRFIQWMKAGTATGSFPGLTIDPDQIVAEQPITLP